MTEQNIKDFLNNSRKKFKDWVACFNFIYSGDASLKNELSPSTIKRINEARKKSKDDFLKEFIDKKNSKTKRAIIENLISWDLCVKNDIINHKKKCIESLAEIKTPIKYIIFSEAPMLTWKKNNKPYSNYIFSNRQIRGSYRSAPYKAFQAPKKLVTHEDLIDTFKVKRVAFIDLIDLPLPISTEIRCKWNYEIKINSKPLTIVFLENALLNFLIEMNENSIDLDQNFEFAFMMPPQTAFGIIEHIRDHGPINVQYNGKTIKIDSGKAIECNDNDTKKLFKYLKEEILPLYSRIAMDGSNNPSDKLLRRALNIL